MLSTGLVGRIGGPQRLRAMTVTHVLGVIAGGWVTAALANSLFFSVSPDASQGQILRYLAITMIPVVFLAPLLGPLLDRFHHSQRRIAAGANIARGVCCVGLATMIGSIGFFGWALALLIANKIFTVSKYALMPQLVDSCDQLVAANTRLAKWSAAAGGIGIAAGSALLAVSGTRMTLIGAGGIFVLAAVAARRLPVSAERIESATRIRLAAACDATERPSRRAFIAAGPFLAIRTAVGFFAFTMAFDLRRAGATAVVMALLATLYGIGSLLGNLLAPTARRRMSEEAMIRWSIGAALAACAAASATSNGVLSVAAAFAIGFAASHIKQAFDSVLQSTSTARNRGRSYARFETRVQIGWVIGAAAATWWRLHLPVATALLTAVLAIGLLVFARRLRVAGVAEHIADPTPVVEPAAAPVADVVVSVPVSAASRRPHWLAPMRIREYAKAR